MSSQTRRSKANPRIPKDKDLKLDSTHIPILLSRTLGTGLLFFVVGFPFAFVILTLNCFCYSQFTIHNSQLTTHYAHTLLPSYFLTFSGISPSLPPQSSTPSSSIYCPQHNSIYS